MNGVGRGGGRTDRHGSEVSKMVSTENEGVREGGQVTSWRTDERERLAAEMLLLWRLVHATLDLQSR